MSGGLPAVKDQRAPKRRPVTTWTGIYLAVAVIVVAAGLVIGHAVLRASPSSPYYVDMTEIDWVDQNQNVIATSHGFNISQGQLVSTSVTLLCSQGPLPCTRAEYVSLLGTIGFGSWPPGVSPCGPFRAAFSVTGSDLPLTILPNGSAVVTLTLLAPDVSYPVQTPYFHYASFDYTGHLDVYLKLSPR